MGEHNKNDIKYLEAKRKVKRMKGFYIHAAVYVLVNLFIIAQNIQEDKLLSDMDNYWTAIFWGIGLLLTLQVFSYRILFWETIGKSEKPKN